MSTGVPLTGIEPIPMKQLFFVRHGQTEWNAIRRMQGRWNSDLSELGRAQARVNADLLATLDPQVLFVSPLDRTRQTAEIINQRLQIPLYHDDRIMEWDCGDWSGYLYDEVRKKWPDEWAALEADQFNFRGPNCENFPDMIARAAPFLDEIRRYDADRIGIVSHGMIGKVMVSLLLGLGESETLALHQPNDVVVAVSIDGEDSHPTHYIGGEGPFPGLFDF
jgi:broad specificity phosphatase PhoE